MKIILVHMHHPVEESPEKDVSEKTSDKAPGEEQPPWFEEFVPPPSGLENEQQGEEKRWEEVKNKAIESSQPQDASCCSRQGRYRGAAVVQHSGVAPHSHFADELWPLALGYDSSHLGSGQLSQVGAAVWAEIETWLQYMSSVHMYFTATETGYQAVLDFMYKT